MPDERTTSFAKSVDGLHHEESALDRARNLRDMFRQAQSERSTERTRTETARESERPGSHTVRTDAPTPFPAPSGPMRTGPDRQASYERLNKERAQAKSQTQRLAAEFRARQKQARDRDMDR